LKPTKKELTKRLRLRNRKDSQSAELPGLKPSLGMKDTNQICEMIEEMLVSESPTKKPSPKCNSRRLRMESEQFLVEDDES
jgi:hypothetical protein